MAVNPQSPPQQRSQPYVFPNVRAVSAYAAAVQGAGVVPQASNQVQGASLLTAPTAYSPKPYLRMRANGEIVIMGAADGSAFMPPLNPLQPMAQYPGAQVVGRQWDYPVGFNTRVTPRGQNKVPFSQLLALAHYDIVAIMISRVQDKICTKPWSIMPKDKKQKPDAGCDAIQDFLQSPDKDLTWSDWSRELVYQLIVYDSPAIYLRPTMGGQLYAMEIIDGSQITPKIMANGRVPPWNMGPGYQHVIQRGLPAVDYTKPVPFGQRPVVMDGQGLPLPELLYKPRNPRPHTPYGYGPIEQLIASIEIGIGRENYLGEYYKSGSTPDLIFTCPKEWTSEQIANFKMWWDSVLTGNLAARRGTMFVPDGATPIDTKAKALTDETDDYLVRRFCYSMGLNPMPFVKMMNKGQEKQHGDEAAEEGQAPWQHYFVDLFNVILPLKFNRPDLCFRWEEEASTDPAEQATIDVALVNAKIYHPDEIRAQRGDEAMEDDMRSQMDMPNFNGAVNSTVLPPDQQAVQNQHALDMAAAKPAPIVAAPGSGNQPPGKGDAQKFEEFLAILEKRQPVHVTVEGPVINPAKIEVHPAAVTVNTPDIKMGDTFVEVGGANVQAKFEAPKGSGPVTKTIDVSRGTNGEMVGTITESTTRNVIGKRNGDGKIVAKVTE